MTAYYNEHDPFAAEWLRQLIKKNIIAPGEVDERDIQKVHADDLKEFAQCHFFAGIGVWSYALRLAGWPDEERVWTGSCPCQPFSVSGKRAGASDERHVWPAWFTLIRESCPELIFGEQVASDDGLAWLDLVSSDLDGQNYTLGAVDTCASGFGAPHIRQRLYFVAESEHARLYRPERSTAIEDRNQSGLGLSERDSSAGELANSSGRRRKQRDEGFGAVQQSNSHIETGGHVEHSIESRLEGHIGDERDGNQPGRLGENPARSVATPSLTNGFWANAEWLWCRDGKYRPVEPATQRMVDGSAASLGRVCEEHRKACEEEIAAYVDANKIDAGEALRDLWQTLSENTLREWSPRRLSGVHESAVLLSFLRQLSEQGWAFSESFSCPSAEATEEILRSLRQQESVARTSRGRGLDEQRTREHSNTLHILSSILARYAQAAWSETFNENARISFPLITGERNRVGRLRGYGNALVAQQAQAFIEAYLGVK